MVDKKCINNKELQDKLYFKVGEVSLIADVPSSVLRFWETQFNRIKPKRTPSGQRLYRRKDVELILEIRHLLYEKKFTIPGAIQHINNKSVKQKNNNISGKFDEIRIELEKIRDLLT